MSFRIIYKNLFEINLLHHFLLDKGEETYDAMSLEEKDKAESNYDIRELFEITPAPDCRKALSAHYCLFKLTPKGILVGIKAKPDDLQPDKFNPFVALDADLTFRFMIKLKDMNFTNYTALPLQGNSDNLFIFKNYKVNAVAKYPSLSAIPPLYNPVTVYLPGDMLSDHATNPAKLFTALLKTSSNTSTVSDWFAETGNETTPISYANVNDRFPVVSGILNYTMKAKNVYPVATISNLAGDNITPKMEILPGDFYSLQADMRNYPEGFYSLHVESSNPVYQDDISFYLVQQSDIPFGMVEIKVKSDLAGFSLLDQGHLLSPSFLLRFRNRRTFWRYSGKIFSIPFVVPDPLPLTRFGHIEIIKPPEPGDTKTILLPNPEEPVIIPAALIKTEETKYYSDIQIN